MISRILKHKGIYELIDAIKILRKKNYDNEFILAGDVDIYNPSSISISQLKKWENQKLIKYQGYIKDLL